jgi:hypothetical protein
MSEFGKFEADKTHLRRVDILSASIENPFEIASWNSEGFHFNLSFEMGFNIEEKLVKYELEVGLHTEFEESEHQATGKFKLAFIFGLDNFDDLVHGDGDGVEVSDELAFALTSIAYSTTRGILLTRFQGTIFREFILPVISPSDLLSQAVPSES